MIAKNFFNKAKDLKLLDMMAPLILYPHNWIRNEAIKIIEVN